MTLQALIFDVDGTLADTERDGHRVAFNRAFADAGLSWDWDAELYLDLLAITGGKERIRHFCERFDPEFLAQPDADEAIRALHAAKTEIYTGLVADGRVQLLPGVRSLIEEARAEGIRLAIATTTSPVNVTSLLHATLGENALTWFDVIGAGDVVDNKKPAPDIYAWVLERLDLPAAACLALEDSLPGYAAARGARIPTVVTPSGRAVGEPFPEALVVLPDLAHTSLDQLRERHASAHR